MLIAQASNAPEWVGWLGGPISAGLIATLLITGQLVPGKRYTEERDERIASQAREREAYQVTTPALIQANTNHATMLEVLRQRREP